MASIMYKNRAGCAGTAAVLRYICLHFLRHPFPPIHQSRMNSEREKEKEREREDRGLMGDAHNRDPRQTSASSILGLSPSVTLLNHEDSGDRVPRGAEQTREHACPSLTDGRLRGWCGSRVGCPPFILEAAKEEGGGVEKSSLSWRAQLVEYRLEY